jgi:hypothetical protein
MERGDRLEYATNPPEPYAAAEIIAMDQRAEGKFNLLVRLHRSTGCRLQEITVPFPLVGYRRTASVMRSRDRFFLPVKVLSRVFREPALHLWF